MDQSLFTNERETVVISDRILYTASAFAKTSLMYLQEIGSLTAKKRHTSKRDRLDSYLFFIVESGAGTVDYDGNSYELRAGDGVFIDCSRPYSHTTSKDELWSLKWIHFNGESMPSIYEKYLSRGGKPVIKDIDSDKLDNITDIHRSIVETASNNDYVRDMRINADLSELLTILMELAWDPEEKDTSRQKKNLLPVKAYIDENYAENIALDELADRFYINKYYLTRIFKEQYGVSIGTYIQQLKITRAKQLLRFTDRTLDEISLSCGIGEANYFSRMFKKIEGISPSGYRAKWKDAR